MKFGVIGSGFGGAVMACRLAEAGCEVHVLERGAAYGRNQFPRHIEQLRDSFWDPDEGYYGLFEYRSFDRSQIDVLTASGLGGGSLIYSSVLYRMPARFFGGWPGGITAPVLEPYYEAALEMLEARPYPGARSPYADTPKHHALAEAAARINGSRRPHPAVQLERPRLAVTFADRPGAEHRNRQGRMQTACTMCGECNLGCNSHSKNTLDLNYLARAEAAGARIRTLCEVREIHRHDHGYGLVLEDPRYRRRAEERFDAVVVAAGSLGSTRLLLQMRRRYPELLSDAVGTRWSPNGDLLGFVMGTRQPVQPSRGPVISAALRFDSGSYPDGFGAGVWIEDGGFPALLASHLGRRLRNRTPIRAKLGLLVRYLRGLLGHRAEFNIGDDLAPALFRDSPLIDHCLPLLAMGRDRSTGRMRLDGRARHRRDRLHLDWRSRGSGLHYRRTRSAMERVAEALGGQLIENPLSTIGRYVSVHPLGGCPIGDGPETGAVNARTGEVFGCPRLYVADGSLLPTSAGPNPSLTIAALAELYAERILEGGLR